MGEDRLRMEERHKLCSYMELHNLELLVLLHNGTHSFLAPNPVFMLSDFKALGESMLLLWRSGVSTLVITPEWDIKRAVRRSAATNTISAENLFRVLQELIRNNKMESRHVGFVGLAEFNKHFVDTITASLHQPPQMLDSIFYRIVGAPKSGKDLERAQKATWIAERGYERMLDVVRPGISEYELAAEIDCLMKKLGADANFQLLTASQHNHAVHTPGERILEEGDILLAEISPSFEGQFTQICRTVLLGDENQRFRQAYGLLIEAMNEGMACAAPGVKMSEVFNVINKPLEEAGYGKYCQPPHMRVRGHGLGMSSVLPGDVSGSNDIVLEEGMVFVMHPNQYIPETGYMLCGEPVVVTQEGAQALTQRTPAIDFIKR